MIYLAENLRSFRRKLEMTQEEVAGALNVAPQTVSKWERGETYPDITLLPALAHLFHTSVDSLLGMEKMYHISRYGEVYTQARVHLRSREWTKAISVYEDALKTWPGDSGLLLDLSMALALSGETRQAEKRCLQAMEHASAKARHTACAALCYLYEKLGEHDKAQQTARQLPHQRESREVVQAHLASQPDAHMLDVLIYELSTGEKMT